MFAKRNRFSFKRRVPRYVYGTPFFAFRYEPIDRQLFECAVVVGKKVDKRAVVRNRIKRQIIAILKEEIGYDSRFAVIVYAKKPIQDATIEQIREALKDALKVTKIQ